VGVGVGAGARFSPPAHNDCDAHSASYTVGAGILPEVKRSGRGADYSPASSARVKERVELYLCSPSLPPLSLSLSLGLRGLFTLSSHLAFFTISNLYGFW
jgi:hypothetical protein